MRNQTEPGFSLRLDRCHQVSRMNHVLSDSLGSNTFAAKYLSSWLDERSDAVSAFTEPGQHTNPALPKIMANRNESD